MKILILKPSSLGDVVQALPVLRLLKHHLPQSQIYWWLQTDLLPLLEGDPDVAGLFPFDRHHWSRPWYWRKLALSLREMRRHHFDWVIDLQGLARSALIAWLAKGALTIGLEDLREGAPAFYDLATPRPAFDTHAVDWYLKVLPLLGVPVHWDFEWLPPRPVVAARLQQRWQPAGQRWFVIQPGARWPNKRWPIEYYAELVQRLAAQETGLRFAVLGSRRETALGGLLAQAAPGRCLDLTGQTSLPEMIEWIRLGELMITNDTGPMHVAAALGKPVVALFGPTHPARTGPYRQTEQVLRLNLPCAPCMSARCRYHQPLECLRGLRPSAVTEAVRGRLREAEFPRPADVALNIS